MFAALRARKSPFANRAGGNDELRFLTNKIMNEGSGLANARKVAENVSAPEFGGVIGYQLNDCDLARNVGASCRFANAVPSRQFLNDGQQLLLISIARNPPALCPIPCTRMLSELRVQVEKWESPIGKDLRQVALDGGTKSRLLFPSDILGIESGIEHENDGLGLTQITDERDRQQRMLEDSEVRKVRVIRMHVRRGLRLEPTPKLKEGLNRLTHGIYTSKR